jgi:ribose transport system ATP-binding protein
LRIEGRSPDRRWTPIVDDVSLAIEHGEVVGLIGESGAGKSTMSPVSTYGPN